MCFPRYSLNCIQFRPRILRIHKFVGDKSGVLHVGPQQAVIGQFSDDGEFKVNTYVYESGVFHLPKSFLCRGIKIVNRYEILRAV